MHAMRSCPVLRATASMPSTCKFCGCSVRAASGGKFHPPVALKLCRCVYVFCWDYPVLALAVTLRWRGTQSDSSRSCPRLFVSVAIGAVFWLLLVFRGVCIFNHSPRASSIPPAVAWSMIGARLSHDKAWTSLALAVFILVLKGGGEFSVLLEYLCVVIG